MTKHPLSLTFHGAAHTVTGSCMEFRHDGRSLLVDCGLFQGSRTLERLNAAPFAFDPARLAAVVLTHAHLDHSGLLPKLAARGYEGPIWCTPQTAALLEYMLADAGRIQEDDAERRNRRRDRAGEEPFAPIYTEADARAAWRLCRPVPLETWFEPAPGFRVRLWNAGHILGSASVELEADGVRVMCSGDIGPEHKAFELSPQGPQGFDHVICEATYGDRDRPVFTLADRRAQLAAEVTEALSRGGNLIIPAFALERTQELLLDLACLLRAGRIPNVPVFVDSPLANEVTSVFQRFASQLEGSDGSDLFDHSAFHSVNDVAESIRLNSISGAIILAASGMCEGGRIRHHLLHNLARRNATVLFVGFQARGTLGSVLLEGAPAVRISGAEVRVQARIRRIDTYSAHADRSELLDWIIARAPVAGSVLLDHGESAALEGLRRDIAAALPQIPLRTPDLGDTYALSAGLPAKRIATGDPGLRQAVGTDWQNAYADFSTSLKRKLTAMPDDRHRERALAAMRRILDASPSDRRKVRSHD